jgi:hypothetical protein
MLAGAPDAIRQGSAMTTLNLLDVLAFVWFLTAWLGYSYVIERTASGRTGLNALMNRHRDEWMMHMLGRENRIVDAQVSAALQNGTAFFASTSLIAIGGTLSLLRAPEAVLPLMSVLPAGSAPSRELWEMKMLGLAIIFVYAFFKFAWSYRLYNYFAILLGAAPPAAEGHGPGQGLCAPRRKYLRRRGPALQPRPARVLFRARLSRLVPRRHPPDGDHAGDRRRDVAAAVRLGVAPRLRSPGGLRAPQAIPISTAMVATTSTAVAVATTVTTRSPQVAVSNVNGSPS